MPARLVLRPLRALTVFLVITALINLFFIATGPVIWQAGPLAIHRDGAHAAVLYTVRFFLMLVAGSLLMRTTRPLALADALQALLRPFERCGLDTGQVALTASIALQFVPILSAEARSIVAAQASRGARWEILGPVAYARAFVPLLVPLFASALRHAEQLGRAMEARAYAGGRARTHLRPPAFRAAARRGLLRAGVPLPHRARGARGRLR